MSVGLPTRLRSSLFASKGGGLIRYSAENRVLATLDSIFSREYALWAAEFNIEQRIGYFGFKKHHFSDFIKVALFLKKYISEKMRIGNIV